MLSFLTVHVSPLSYVISQASLCYACDRNTQIFHSGVSHHFCRDRNLFVKFKSILNEEINVAVKGISFPIEGKGEIKLSFGQRVFTFTDVMYTSQLRLNLISGPELDNGRSIVCRWQYCNRHLEGKQYFVQCLFQRVFLSVISTDS